MDRVAVSSAKTGGTQTRDTIAAESSDIDQVCVSIPAKRWAKLTSEIQMVSQALSNAATRILKVVEEEMLGLEARMQLSPIQAERSRL